MSDKEPTVVDKWPQTVLVVGITLAALVHKNHSAIDCYQFQGNASPKNNVQMQNYNWLLGYLCASVSWVFLCFFHFRQFEDEKASLAMVDKAKPVIDTGNASFAFLFEKVSLNSTFGSLPTLLILFLPTALPMSELS